MKNYKEQLIDTFEYQIADSLGYDFLENLQAISKGNEEMYYYMLRGAFYAIIEKKVK